MNEKFYDDQRLIKEDENQWKSFSSNVNTVVIAGPGSGKTRVLTLKAIKLIQSDIHYPSGIGCISYSRETVRELKKRLKEYGYNSNKRNFIGTMHGFCLVHVIEPFSHLFPQYKIPFPLKIAPSQLTEEIYSGVLKELNIDPNTVSKRDFDKQRALSFIGKCEVVILNNLFEDKVPELYEKRLFESGSVDFISLVNTATLMIREQEYVKKTLESRFPWLLIDEYQDLGLALHEMILELDAQTDIKIFAVGDMNQSIYGFNGAYPDFLDELDSKDDFESIHLAYNYRSNQEIIEGSLDALNAPPPRPSYVAKKRTEESAKFTFITCDSEMIQQYNIVAEKVIPNLIKNGVEYKDIGILVWSGKEVVQMASSLKDNNIPFYIVKWDFSNTDFLYWLQECAQWCINSKDNSFDELFGFWKQLLETHDDSRSTWEIIRQRTELHQVLTKSKAKHIVEYWLEFVLFELEINQLLKDSERYPDENDNISRLLHETKNKNLKDASLNRFAYLGEPENEVTITTRHSAKGLEFEVVIMLGLEEGRFPFTYKIEEKSREMKEAYRLCYVSISRAKSECVLIRSKEHTIIKKNGQPWTIPYKASRFWVTLLKRFNTGNNVFKVQDYK